MADHIDSCYLLIVKFSLNEPPTCHPYFVDLLDCLDFATFDSGPGQMMLKEREFYPAMGNGFHQQRNVTLAEKIEALFRLLENGEQRLFRNRASALERFRRLIEEYRQGPDHLVNQESLHLIP
ncbi:hypothetical protein HY630_03050 [Candidatus Uhrbacteria bacterium]|nr:hypothetical protein [Candidatus Uhrbacteria bacterium]